MDDKIRNAIWFLNIDMIFHTFFDVFKWNQSPRKKNANDLLERKQFMEFEINWEFQSNDFCKITVENDEFLVMKISNSRQINGRIAFVSIR